MKVFRSKPIFRGELTLDTDKIERLLDLDDDLVTLAVLAKADSKMLNPLLEYCANLLYCRSDPTQDQDVLILQLVYLFRLSQDVSKIKNIKIFFFFRIDKLTKS